MMTRKMNEASICNHGRTNKDSHAYGYNSQHGRQNETKDLPRASM
jgi:hypothetical protein